jgi:glycosyltransferase involved in cell wall biosynthesis
VNGRPTWHVLAGEYPPQCGGVAGYTARLAEGLAAASEVVHVWALGPLGEAGQGAGLTVHRVGDRWSPAALGRVGAGVDALPAPRTLLVQYTPNTWGYKGLNIGLCRWLAGRKRRGDDVRVMFHELWYFPQPGDPLARRGLAAAQRLLTRSLVAACSVAYVSIPYWGELLRRYPAGRRRPVVWLPALNNIPVVPDPEGPAAVRRLYAGPGQLLVEHFGTYGGRTADLLAQALPPVLDGSAGAFGLMIGPNGGAFVDRVVSAHPELRGRLAATGELSEPDVSRHLRACDLIVQPYPGGVTSRRSSVMAALAHGVPVVTTSGEMTEPLWAESGAVVMTPEGDAASMASAVAALWRDPAALARLGQAGRRLFERRFAVERTVEVLTGQETGAGRAYFALNPAPEAAGAGRRT